MTKRTITIASVALLLALLGSVTLAQARSAQPAPTGAPTGGGGFEISWYTIDSGGAMFSTGGPYSLGGSIGQADTGTLNSGSYTLNGGFWPGATGQYRVYLPLILR
jgi:hypothetical protein